MLEPFLCALCVRIFRKLCKWGPLKGACATFCCEIRVKHYPDTSFTYETRYPHGEYAVSNRLFAEFLRGTEPILIIGPELCSTPPRPPLGERLD